MSMLFEPIKLGSLRIPNRFVRAATYEAMATESGEVTEAILESYHRLARGEIGLIITGFIYVHPLGRVARHQLGIHDDRTIEGLARLTDLVHQEGSKVVFQLVHAGRQTTPALIGQTPLAPSSRGRDPINFVKPRAMDEDQIHEAVRAFGDAAGRAAEAGADGVEIHAAHGYLINQFLSPFYNVRDDAWGGSAENRFRFLGRVVGEVSRVLPEGMPILVKLNTYDDTPQQGVTPELAATYAGWLADLGIHGLEVSRGSTLYAPFEMARGTVPVDELAQRFPWWQRAVARLKLSGWKGKFELQGAYNLAGAQVLKPELGTVPLILTGGLRTVAQMEDALESGAADLIGMSRPFIREPSLVRRIRQRRVEGTSCISCNRCFAAIANEMPLRCYVSGLPD
jgi:2,4-dienoyl-CoA reductase-like NADH-dependent reductase (Old Yellow Enzyme family)